MKVPLFTIPKGTVTLTIREGIPWDKENFKVYHTKSETTFDRFEVILTPERGCSLQIPKADETGRQWAKNNYYGFKRGEHILIAWKWDIKFHEGETDEPYGANQDGDQRSGNAEAGLYGSRA